MNENPYQAPSSPVQDGEAFEIPADLQKKIRSATYAGIASGVMTGVFALIAYAGTSIAGSSVWSLFDMVLIFGLTYGVHRRSRAASTILFSYFVLGKILQVVTAPDAMAGLVLGAVFAYLYFQGMVATYRYHALKKESLQR